MYIPFFTGKNTAYVNPRTGTKKQDKYFVGKYGRVVPWDFACFMLP